MASLRRVESVYIGWVEISPAMAEKLQSKHGVTPDDVRDACSLPIRPRWNNHPKHGYRLLLTGRTRHGTLLKVILQPVDVRDGTWRLRTAFPADGQ
jgi:hypothetical protein